MTAVDCRCPKPQRPITENVPPWRCVRCGGFACDYARPGRTRCSPAICDCFIEGYPESPMDLHPEAFIVGRPTAPAHSQPETGADAGEGGRCSE